MQQRFAVRPVDVHFVDEEKQEKLMWLQDPLQELTFSNHAYGTELRDETAQLYRDMASDATARQSRLKRMWYRYGRCFC